jgi:phosphate-selective porin OprO/OprP
VGKFKQPFGLEQLQSSGAIAAIERGLPTELTPARDYGVQLQGEFASSTLNYAVGVFNGTVDGRDSATSNPDNEFEATARVFWEPFKNDANAWSGFGVGIATSVSDNFGQGNNFLPRYRTPGQSTFFSYRNEAAADGLHRRWSPQAYYYNGPLGLLAEYVTSEQEVRLVSGADAGRVEHLENESWQVVGSWVLTGEDTSYRGVARPNHPFTVGAAGWGALELIARYGELDIDDDAFPLFANPTASASRVDAWSIGLNWYLTQNLKLVANYTQAAFDGGAAAGDREDEKTLFTRAQISF